MSSASATWKLNDGDAQLSCGPLRATVVFHENGGSLAIDEWDGEKSRNPVCGENRNELESRALVTLTFARVLYESEKLQLAETYVRGRDLVASYAESGDQRVAPQIYWRAEHVKEFNATKIELIASVKTALLDSESVAIVHTAINMASQVLHSASLDSDHFGEIAASAKRQGEGPPARVFKAQQSSNQLFVARFPQFRLAFAQMVHPTDFDSVEAALEETSHFWLSNILFTQPLEKGVIRRARICGWFLPIENDLETAVQLARQFIDEPLPLTA
jgi:hypothetical protein